MSLYKAYGLSSKFALFVANEGMRKIGWSSSPELLLENFSRREKNERRSVFEAIYTILDTRMAYKAIVVIKKEGRNWEKGEVTLVHCSGCWTVRANFRIDKDEGFTRVKLGKFFGSRC